MRNELNVSFKISEGKARGRHVAVFVDGVLVGSRQSHRTYTHVLLVKRSQTRAIERAKEDYDYALKEAAVYDTDIANTTSAVIRFGEAQLQKWAADCRDRAARLLTELARLNSGPQPEFNEWQIYGWSSSARNCKLPGRLVRYYSHAVPVEVK